MHAFVYLEARQSDDGKRYQLGLGCYFHPKMASMILLLSRLF